MVYAGRYSQIGQLRTMPALAVSILCRNNNGDRRKFTSATSETIQSRWPTANPLAVTIMQLPERAPAEAV